MARREVPPITSNGESCVFGGLGFYFNEAIKNAQRTCNREWLVRWPAGSSSNCVEKERMW